MITQFYLSIYVLLNLQSTCPLSINLYLNIFQPINLSFKYTETFLFMDMFIRRAEAATETGARNCAAVMTDVDAMIPPPTISQQNTINEHKM